MSTTVRLSIGIGYDSHRMVRGRPCILGGVRFEHPFGPAGHSDGDALLHAVCDAVLGACGLPDIGAQFPDTDPAFRGADSAVLARRVMRKVRAAGFSVGSLDAVVVCDAPRIGPRVPQLRRQLAALFDCRAVNVKGKTTEGAHPRMVEVYATALVVRRNSTRRKGA